MLPASPVPYASRSWPLAIIPAFNEAARIAAVIHGLRAQGLEVLVVDDGSSDGTGLIAHGAGARVLSCRNGGKGSALLTGCRWAVGAGYARVLLLDADGQHDPHEASVLIAAGLAGAQLVIGRRCKHVERQPLVRRGVNRLSSLLVTLAAGRAIRDSQSGYRLCDPRLLLSLPVTGRHYDLETEVCILAARRRLRIREVPISVIYNDKKSGVHPLFDTLRFFRAVLLSLGRCRSRRALAMVDPAGSDATLPSTPVAVPPAIALSPRRRLRRLERLAASL